MSCAKRMCPERTCGATMPQNNPWAGKKGKEFFVLVSLILVFPTEHYLPHISGSCYQANRGRWWGSQGSCEFAIRLHRAVGAAAAPALWSPMDAVPKPSPDTSLTPGKSEITRGISKRGNSCRGQGALMWAKGQVPGASGEWVDLSVKTSAVSKRISFSTLRLDPLSSHVNPHCCYSDLWTC